MSLAGQNIDSPSSTSSSVQGAWHGLGPGGEGLDVDAIAFPSAFGKPASGMARYEGGGA